MREERGAGTAPDCEGLPRHIAFIMDGNGRWAKKRLLPRNMGHRAGVKSLEKVLESAFGMGVSIVTVFAFSTENWNRSKEEVDGLFDILRNYFHSHPGEYAERGIRVKFLGDLSRLPADLIEACGVIADKTADCDKFQLNIALNYGGRDELLRAARLAAENGEELTEESFKKFLYTGDIPDPDLVVRTSGEMRVSNFLLYQTAYSELYFTDTLWPDFGERELKAAIEDYRKRSRRFGRA